MWVRILTHSSIYTGIVYMHMPVHRDIPFAWRKSNGWSCGTDYRCRQRIRRTGTAEDCHGAPRTLLQNPAPRTCAPAAQEDWPGRPVSGAVGNFSAELFQKLGNISVLNKQGLKSKSRAIRSHREISAPNCFQNLKHIRVEQTGSYKRGCRGINSHTA